jgi:hypothetical protein
MERGTEKKHSPTQKPEITPESNIVNVSESTPTQTSNLESSFNFLATTDSVSQWSIEKVGEWVEDLATKIDIGDGNTLKQKFIQSRINGRRLEKFTVDFGKTLGIPEGDSMDIEEAISNLKQGTFNSIHHFRKQEKRTRGRIH